MQEENKRVEIEDENTDYIAALQEMKANTVSKDQYNKVKADNKRLLDAMLNNEQVEVNSQAATVVRTPKEIAEAYFDETLPNREKIKLALEYRDQVILTKGYAADPFVNQSEFSKPTQADYIEAQHVADGLKEILDNSVTDEEFIMEYNRQVR